MRGEARDPAHGAAEPTTRTGRWVCQDHMTAARTRNEPTTRSKRRTASGRIDGKSRHPSSSSERDVDVLDGTASRAFVGFDVEPALDRLTNVRERVLACPTLTGAAG